MSDLIDRQAAIDAINEYMAGKRCDTDGTMMARLINELVINKLPSALGTNLAEVGTDCISRQQAIKALSTITMYKGSIPYNTAVMRIEQLPSAQPEIIRCKDCDWWTKQEASLQGRCALMGMYPTGGWFCGNARKRKVTE